MPGGVINPKGRGDLNSTIRDTTPRERPDNFVQSKAERKAKAKKKAERKARGISFKITKLSSKNPLDPFKGKSMSWIAMSHPSEMRKLLASSTLQIDSLVRVALVKLIK